MSPRRLEEFEPFTRAERTLIEGLDVGAFDRLEGGSLPEEGDERREIRAALLRFLILGGPDAPPVHEKGIRLIGAWIAGQLDLEGCRIPRDLGLVDCRFDAPLVLRSAVIDTLFLDGSLLPGFFAERLEARGDLYLRSAAVTGPVLLPNGRLGGSLVADGARIRRPSDLAIDAAGLDARGSVLLRGAEIEGGVDMTNARVAGDIILSGARIERAGETALAAEGVEVGASALLRTVTVRGTVRADGAAIAGDMDVSGAAFEAPGDVALSLARARVGAAFILRDGARIEGLLGLNGAALGLVVDDPASWPGRGDLALNRCLYGAFIASPVDAATRLDWLSRQDPERWGDDFWPQPYQQLAAVLAEMGHEEDAARVLFEKERLQRRARRLRAGSWTVRALLWARDALLRVTVGYGRQPMLVILWLAVLWMSGTAVLAYAEYRDAIRPNMPFVLRSPEWLLCAVDRGGTLDGASLAAERPGLAAPGQSQLDCYRAQPEAASYPAYNPLMFAVDALLPALDTGQRTFWSPDTRSPVGVFAKGYSYFLKIAGWALSLLAVAAFSGLVRSR